VLRAVENERNSSIVSLVMPPILNKFHAASKSIPQYDSLLCLLLVNHTFSNLCPIPFVNFPTAVSSFFQSFSCGYNASSNRRKIC
jgi:hypothetical protein